MYVYCVSVHMCELVSVCMCIVYECMCGFVRACLCVCECVCAGACARMLQYAYEGQRTTVYQSSPSTLLETSPVHYYVRWAGWRASLRSPGLHLPRHHRRTGITDVCCWICLHARSGIRTQVLTAVQPSLPGPCPLPSHTACWFIWANDRCQYQLCPGDTTM